MKNKLYLAGKMSGLPDYNYPKFYELEEKLMSEGWVVFNPARTDEGSTHKPREYYLRQAIRMLLCCDTIALIPGWEDSPGACLEVAIAQQLGMGIICAETGEPLEPQDLLILQSEFDEAAAKIADEEFVIPNLEVEWDEEEPEPNCLEEAARVVDGPRQEAYGHPAINHSRTADFWTTYKGVVFTPSDVCWMMVLQKIAREVNCHKDDNEVDVCGYVRNAQLVRQYFDDPDQD